MGSLWGRWWLALHLRAGAFGLDAVLPYIAVLIITGEWASSGYVGTLRNWLGVLANPEELALPEENPEEVELPDAEEEGNPEALELPDE